VVEHGEKREEPDPDRAVEALHVAQAVATDINNHPFDPFEAKR
jgi:hypothetical protein